MIDSAKAPVDPNYDVPQLLMSIEAVLGDPTVTIPPGLKPTAVVTGNRIRITITGW